MLHSDIFAQSLAAKCKLQSKQFRPIDGHEANSLNQALNDDARNLAQVAFVSYLEGVGGALYGRYSWATVKLYYTVFYALRAILMLRGWSVFYVGRTPHFLRAKSGESVTKAAGNSHSVTFDIFNRTQAADLLISQEIGSVSPLVWFENLRNRISYKTAPYNDPEATAEFAKFAEKPRAALQVYVDDNQLLYAFDQDHAVVAYPMLTLERLVAEMASQEMILVGAHHLKMIRDKNCYIHEMKKKFSAFDFGA